MIPRRLYRCIPLQIEGLESIKRRSLSKAVRRVTWKEPPPRVRIVDGKLVITMGRPDGTNFDLRALPGRWLRDNCDCEQCRNPVTGQRRINIFRDPTISRLQRARTLGSSSRVQVTFMDHHQASYNVHSIISRHSNDTDAARLGYVKPMLWRSTISEQPPTVNYAKIQKEGLGDLLLLIRQYGFAFVDNMPPTPEATKELIEQIGPIRNTHYGGFYDFTSDLSWKDTAYTAEALEPHTDTTYFTDPIGIQALHLLSHTDGSGGLSSLVDGFRAVQLISTTYRKILAKTKVWAHASGNEGISIQPAFASPVLERYDLDPTHTAGDAWRVRWNNADRAGLSVDISESDEWYDAASSFDKILNHEANMYWFQLQPGKCLLFDNWRVLHGRSAFTGKRRICGGYVNRDDFISKYRMTNLTPEAIERSTVTG